VRSAPAREPESGSTRRIPGSLEEIESLSSLESAGKHLPQTSEAPASVNVGSMTDIEVVVVASRKRQRTPPWARRTMVMADPRDLAELLNPAARGDGYFAVKDEAGELIGFFHYKEPHAPRLEIGLGLHPDRTGQGLGKSFVEAGLDCGRERFGPRAFHALRRQVQPVRNQRLPARRLLRGPRLLALDEWRRVGVRRNGTTRLASPSHAFWRARSS
jgi:GNAT superfamily N-acetyltransferase